uniref:DNA topoisomerase 2 n=1 Tax=Rhizophora mucronata TaxID=61149 RepID=A0A2P2LWU3_RHIMU
MWIPLLSFFDRLLALSTAVSFVDIFQGSGFAMLFHQSVLPFVLGSLSVLPAPLFTVFPIGQNMLMHKFTSCWRKKIKHYRSMEEYFY